MRISIRLKFSIFLAVLLLLTVAILSLLVLDGIKGYQQAQYENLLAKEAGTANLFITQSSLTESAIKPDEFVTINGSKLVKQLTLISQSQVVLYDKQGKIIGSSISNILNENLDTTLSFALNGKTSYQREDDSLYYMAPITIGAEQIGVVQFYYSLKQDNEFYRHIQMLFVEIGVLVFALSFIIGYLYFSSFANGILKLKKIADKIRIGQYETEVLNRKDELGRLSESLGFMSSQIMKTINELESEQENLSLAVERLTLLEKQQKQFIGNVTHEFKTPLTSIRAYLDLLDMYPEDADLLNDAKSSINKQAKQLEEMVEKILQLSTMEKYDFELKMEKTDVCKIIRQACSSLKGKAERYGVTVSTDLAEMYIMADKEYLFTILINLLDNSVKYNKANGSIHVRNFISDSQVHIEISDTGIGIPHKMVEKIFEPFYVVEKNRSRQTGGTGLGLTLAKALADKHKGTIALAKTGEEGSTFVISFPLFEEDVKII